MSKHHSITITLGGVVAYFLLIAFCLSESLPDGLADDPTVKGKGKDGECIDYALALSSRLAANGIHGQLIFYRWQIRHTAIEGSHVFVLYRLPDDSVWIVDNEIPHPRKVPREASTRQLVFLLRDAPSDQVDVQLQDCLNHLSYF
ncbi:MAG: hypothetical protein WB586_17445 [Chthoniobacterales bacterium]